MPSQIVQINYDFNQHGSTEKFITQYNVNFSFFYNSPTAALHNSDVCVLFFYATTMSTLFALLVKNEFYPVRTAGEPGVSGGLSPPADRPSPLLLSVSRAVPGRTAARSSPARDPGTGWVLLARERRAGSARWRCGTGPWPTR